MSTKDDVKRETDAAKQKLHEATDEVRSRVSGVASQAQDAAASYADEGKRAAADQLSTFARAIRRAGDELGGESGQAAGLVNQAADQIERLAGSISSANFDDMVSGVTTFARRNPGLFLVGAIAAGVALGRFAKASSERTHYDDSTGSYGSDPYRMPRPQGTGSGQYGMGGQSGMGQTGGQARGAMGGSGMGSSGMGGSGMGGGGAGSRENYPGATEGTTYGSRQGTGGPGAGGGVAGTGGSNGNGNGMKQGSSPTPRVGPASSTPTN